MNNELQARVMEKTTVSKMTALYFSFEAKNSLVVPQLSNVQPGQRKYHCFDTIPPS